MAGDGSSIFNKQAVERLRSPDDLDRYLRATTPGVWMVLFAVFVLSVGLLAWGIFGSVSASVSTTGASLNGKVYCMLDGEQVAQVHEGDSAYVGNQQARVARISKVPLSSAETKSFLSNDYLVEALMPGEWGYLVVLEGASLEAEGVPVTVSITTARIAPISLVLGGTQ